MDYKRKNLIKKGTNENHIYKYVATAKYTFKN